MTWSLTHFQDPRSPTISALESFHNTSIITLAVITVYVAMSIIIIFIFPYSFQPKTENHELEITWTLLPGIILILLALPSLRLLYLIEETTNPLLVVKIIGHQWYWSYDYGATTGLEFDSFIVPTRDLNPGDLRLLEVDNRIVLPWGIEARLLVTSADVLHSWTIPSAGVKADAVPGRLNQIILTPIKPGVFYGQCSEICGANHSFIPIAIEIIHPPKWMKWVSALTN